MSMVNSLLEDCRKKELERGAEFGACEKAIDEILGNPDIPKCLLPHVGYRIFQSQKILCQYLDKDTTEHILEREITDQEWDEVCFKYFFDNCDLEMDLNKIKKILDGDNEA